MFGERVSLLYIHMGEEQTKLFWGFEGSCVSQMNALSEISAAH